MNARTAKSLQVTAAAVETVALCALLLAAACGGEAFAVAPEGSSDASGLEENPPIYRPGDGALADTGVDGGGPGATGDGSPEVATPDASADAAACSDACLACTYRCTQGQTSCVPGGLATCVLGANGCWDYGTPACTGAHQACTGALGSAACGCKTDPVCGRAGTVCASPSTLATCAQDPQGCFYQSESGPCMHGMTCQSGTCGCSGGTPTLCGSACTDTVSDAFNCGACGHDCLGGACTAGICQPLVLSTPLAGAGGLQIAVDATSVYYPTQTSIEKVGVNGGAVTTLVTGLVNAFSVVESGATLYFTEFNPNGRVMKAGIDGSNPSAIATGQSNAFGLAVDAANVYWVTGGSPLGMSNGSVMKAPLSGGAPVTLVANQVQPSAIAVDGTNVYWTTYTSAGSVFKADLDGSHVVALAGGRAFPSQIVVFGGQLYFNDSGGAGGSGEMLTMNLDGTNLVTLATGQDSPSGAMAVDATGVYWTNNGNSGTVMKVGLGGGAPVTLAAGQSHPFFAAVDGSSMYYGTHDPSIRKVAK